MAATSGTVAGRPQPQTTAEVGGGPFIRHAPDGRRAMYVFGGGAQNTALAQFMAPPMVSSPGWNKGYRLLTTFTGGNYSAAGAITGDAPWNFYQLIQMKDAFGTQLLTGPGYDIAYLVPLYGGQFGTDEMATPQASPAFAPINTSTGAGHGNASFPTYLPFEFAKGYGVISGANAALLPVLQINMAPYSTVETGGTVVTSPTSTTTVDADFYWLPNVPADPPGIGTTQQWIYQPCNPTIPSGASQFVQLPRLGGYLTKLIFDLRDASGVRLADGGDLPNQTVGWPSRPKILVDGVPLIDSLFLTLCEDLAIACQIGAWGNSAASNAGGTNSGTIQTHRPAGTISISRKTSLAQREFGLLDTGEIFLSTNPGTQLEIGGFPWGTVGSAPMTLNAVVGQVVPSGALVRGLPEA